MLPRTSGGAPILQDGWLRLQIFGRDKSLCLPGDLDKEGDVDLADFSTFAMPFAG